MYIVHGLFVIIPPCVHGNSLVLAWQLYSSRRIIIQWTSFVFQLLITSEEYKDSLLQNLIESESSMETDNAPT